MGKFSSDIRKEANGACRRKSPVLLLSIPHHNSLIGATLIFQLESRGPSWWTRKFGIGIFIGSRTYIYLSASFISAVGWNKEHSSLKSRTRMSVGKKKNVVWGAARAVFSPVVLATAWISTRKAQHLCIVVLRMDGVERSKRRSPFSIHCNQRSAPFFLFYLRFGAW